MVPPTRISNFGFRIFDCGLKFPLDRPPLKIRNRQSAIGNPLGFTLTELLIVVVPLLIAFGGMALVLEQSGRNAWLLADAQLDSETDAQRVVDRISEDLRAMPASTVQCTASTQLRMGTGPSPITYQFTAIGTGSYAGTGTLTRTVGTGMSATQQTISPRLTLFSCTPLDANRVVTLQVTSRGRTVQGRTVDRTLATRVWVQIP